MNIHKHDLLLKNGAFFIKLYFTEGNAYFHLSNDGEITKLDSFSESGSTIIEEYQELCNTHILNSILTMTSLINIEEVLSELIRVEDVLLNKPKELSAMDMVVFDDLTRFFKKTYAISEEEELIRLAGKIDASIEFFMDRSDLTLIREILPELIKGIKLIK